MSQVPPPPPPPEPPSFPPPSSPPPSFPPAGPPSAFSPGAAFGYGWSAFWKNVGPMVGITIVIWLVSLVLNLLGRATGSAGSVIFGLIGLVVSFILGMGLIRASLAVTRGEKPEISMLTNTDRLGPYAVAAILFFIGAVIGFALVIIPGIIFVLIYMFHGYVIVDSPTEISGIDALKASGELTKGHRGELFLLVLILLGVNIVGLLLCGIGLLFTYGISAITVAAAYRMLKGEPLAPVG
ncbi:MAG: hypothetical protein JWL73_3481 [Actinomycetia bacterium]|nr:hypothetical protein [Actinomycetes bacterium]